MKCGLCMGCSWVCENHPHKPWEGVHACTCGAAAAPCPWCNGTGEGKPPRLPEGFEVDDGTAAK